MPGGLSRRGGLRSALRAVQTWMPLSKPAAALADARRHLEPASVRATPLKAVFGERCGVDLLQLPLTHGLRLRGALLGGCRARACHA